MRDDFLAGFASWIQAEWDRELATDFSLLESIKEKNADAVVEFMRSLSWSDRRKWATAFARRAIARWGGDPVSSREQRLIDEYLSVVRHQEMRKALEPHWTERKPMNRRILRRAIEDTGLLRDAKREEGKVFIATRLFRTCRVDTWIELGGWLYDLTYYHFVHSLQDAPIVQHVSVLPWFGVAGQTAWDDANHVSEEELAGTLRMLCDHFLGAVSEIDKGRGGG